MADQPINGLPKKTAALDTDAVLMIGASEEYQIDYGKLADAILNKLTSKTFALEQGSKSLVAALDELNSKTSNIKYIDIKGDEGLSKAQNLTEAARYIVDKLLPYDGTAKTFYFVTFAKTYTFLMIAQKSDWSNGYGSFIVFGYGTDTMLYGAKVNGVWK